MFFIQTIKKLHEAKIASRAADQFIKDMLYCGELVYRQLTDLENYGVDLKKHLKEFEVSEVNEKAVGQFDKQYVFTISFKLTDCVKIKVTRFSNGDLAKRLGRKDHMFCSLTIYILSYTREKNFFRFFRSCTIKPPEER